MFNDRLHSYLICECDGKCGRTDGRRAEETMTIWSTCLYYAYPPGPGSRPTNHRIRLMPLSSLLHAYTHIAQAHQVQMVTTSNNNNGRRRRQRQQCPLTIRNRCPFHIVIRINRQIIQIFLTFGCFRIGIVVRTTI